MARSKKSDALRALIKKLGDWLPAKQTETRKKILALGKDAVPSLNWALTSLADGLHLPACELLGQIGDERALGPLLRFLGRTKSPMNRNAAARALGRIGSTKAFKPLLCLLEEDDIRSRDEAAEALGLLGDRRALPHLVEMLDHEDDYARAAASRGLGHLGDPAAVMPLLASRKRPWTRKQKRAEKALVAIGGSTLPLLREALIHEEWYVREGAVRVLGRLGDLADGDLLMARLDDSHGEVRFAAVEALGHLGDVRAVDPLLAFRKRTKSPGRLRAIAKVLEALGWQAPHPTSPARLDLLVSKGAWEELEGLGPSAVPALLRTTRDSDYFLRLEAVKVLGRIGHASALPRLLACLGDRAPGVRAEAAEALGRIGDARHLPALVALLDEKEPTLVHARVARALALLGDRKAIPHLRPFLEPVTRIRETLGRTFAVRLAAAEALRALRFRPRRTKERVLLLVAAGAWEELEAMGSKALPSILKSLGAEREDEQQAMVRVLGRIGDLAAAAGVIDWLFSRPAFIRESSQRRAWREDLTPLFRDFADMILRVASSVTCKKIDHSRGSTDDIEFRYDLRVSHSGLRKLCATEGDVAVYLLHRVAAKADGEVVVRDYEDEIWGARTKGSLSFKSQRGRAAKELERRGGPKARRAVLRNKSAWRF